MIRSKLIFISERSGARQVSDRRENVNLKGALTSSFTLKKKKGFFNLQNFAEQVILIYCFFITGSIPNFQIFSDRCASEIFFFLQISYFKCVETVL